MHQPQPELPQPELPQPSLVWFLPCSPSTTYLMTGGPSRSSQATASAAFLLFHMAKNCSSAWENHSLPLTVLRAAVLQACSLPFVHREVTWLISEHQIPRRKKLLTSITQRSAMRLVLLASIWFGSSSETISSNHLFL